VDVVAVVVSAAVVVGAVAAAGWTDSVVLEAISSAQTGRVNQESALAMPVPVVRKHSAAIGWQRRDRKTTRKKYFPKSGGKDCISPWRPHPRGRVAVSGVNEKKHFFSEDKEWGAESQAAMLEVALPKESGKRMLDNFSVLGKNSVFTKRRKSRFGKGSP